MAAAAFWKLLVVSLSLLISKFPHISLGQSSARRVRHRRGQIMVHLQPFTVNGTKTSVLVPAYTHERGAPTGDDGADIPSSTSRKELAARTRSIPSTASPRQTGRATGRERGCQDG